MLLQIQMRKHQNHYANRHINATRYCKIRSFSIFVFQTNMMGKEHEKSNTQFGKENQDCSCTTAPLTACVCDKGDARHRHYVLRLFLLFLPLLVQVNIFKKNKKNLREVWSGLRTQEKIGTEISTKGRSQPYWRQVIKNFFVTEWFGLCSSLIPSDRMISNLSSVTVCKIMKPTISWFRYADVTLCLGILLWKPSKKIIAAIFLVQEQTTCSDLVWFFLKFSLKQYG